MLSLTQKQRLHGGEIVYQIFIFALVLAAFSLSRRDLVISPVEIVSFINYAITALFIGYWVIPRYNRNRNIPQLILFFILALLICIVIEETLIEKWFFPDDRGQDVLVFWTILSVLPKLSLLIAFKLAWDLIFIRKEMDELKSIAQKNELQFLQTQINPHFLFNNLNNIYAFSLEGSSKTPEIILKLSDMLRYILYDCKQEMMSLKQELNQLENFVQLNELQFENRGHVLFESSGPITQNKIAPLILLIFVENAFKHSMSSLSEGIDIKIKTKVTTDGKLVFNCTNNFSAESNIDKLAKGVGLKNVRKRLDLIYRDEYELDIHSSSDMYTVRLILPLTQI